MINLKRLDRPISYKMGLSCKGAPVCVCDMIKGHCLY